MLGTSFPVSGTDIYILFDCRHVYYFFRHQFYVYIYLFYTYFNFLEHICFFILLIIDELNMDYKKMATLFFALRVYVAYSNQENSHNVYFDIVFKKMVADQLPVPVYKYSY